MVEIPLYTTLKDGERARRYTYQKTNESYSEQRLVVSITETTMSVTSQHEFQIDIGVWNNLSRVFLPLLHDRYIEFRRILDTYRLIYANLIVKNIKPTYVQDI